MRCNKHELYVACNEEPWQDFKGGRENVRFGFKTITPVALEEEGSKGTRTRDREDSSGPGRMVKT